MNCWRAAQAASSGCIPPVHPITTAPTDVAVEVVHDKSGFVALAQWDAERQVWIRVGDPLRRALHRVTGWRPWLEELLVNVAMIEAARRAEYDYLRGRAIDGDRFIPTPDAVIKAMLTAALELVEVETLTVEQPKKPAIVSARKPRARR